MPFLVVFLCWPVLEIISLLMVGDEIGLLNTLLLLIAIGIAGAVLVQVQGLATMAAIQDALRRGELPVAAMFDGMCLFIAGVLMIIPGFFSDVFALGLLVPVLRDVLRGTVARFLTGGGAASSGFGGADGGAIDAEFSRLDDPGTPRDGRNNDDDPRLLS